MSQKILFYRFNRNNIGTFWTCLNNKSIDTSSELSTQIPVDRHSTRANSIAFNNLASEGWSACFDISHVLTETNSLFPQQLPILHLLITKCLLKFSTPMTKSFRHLLAEILTDPNRSAPIEWLAGSYHNMIHFRRVLKLLSPIFDETIGIWWPTWFGRFIWHQRGRRRIATRNN